MRPGVGTKAACDGRSRGGLHLPVERHTAACGTTRSWRQFVGRGRSSRDLPFGLDIRSPHCPDWSAGPYPVHDLGGTQASTASCPAHWPAPRGPGAGRRVRRGAGRRICLGMVGRPGPLRAVPVGALAVPRADCAGAAGAGAAPPGGAGGVGPGGGACQHDTFEAPGRGWGLAHSSSALAMPSFSIKPSVAPLTGRSSAKVSTRVSGKNIAASIQSAGL